jgi:hypothetical protein
MVQNSADQRWVKRACKSGARDNAAIGPELKSNKTHHERHTQRLEKKRKNQPARRKLHNSPEPQQTSPRQNRAFGVCAKA